MGWEGTCKIGKGKNEKVVSRMEAALGEFYARDITVHVMLHETCSRVELMESEICQVCDESGKVIGVRLPCVHCWSNKFTKAVGYSSDNSITLVQSNDKLEATLYSSHTCGNWECPEVQRKFQEYVDGTGGKYVGKGALADRQGVVQLPAGGTTAMDQDSFETYMQVSGVKTGFLARFSSNNSKLLKKLPEDV